MSFSKRHYEEVARIIREERAAWPHHDAQRMAQRFQHSLRQMFAADNPRFDATRFDMACEPKGGDK